MNKSLRFLAVTVVLLTSFCMTATAVDVTDLIVDKSTISYIHHLDAVVDSKAALEVVAPESQGSIYFSLSQQLSQAAKAYTSAQLSLSEVGWYNLSLTEEEDTILKHAA